MITAGSPPLVGFNNNVRYRGMRFHIQTEDSGVARPHIVTHLFADGGHIIKSVRTDYAEYVGKPDRPARIHKMMREQHRAMALDLRDGRLDAIIDGLARGAPQAPEKPARPGDGATASDLHAPLPLSPPLLAAPAPQLHGSVDTLQGSALAKQQGERPLLVASRYSAPSSSHMLAQLPEASSESPSSTGSESIFGALPEESLDEIILRHLSARTAWPTPGSQA